MSIELDESNNISNSFDPDPTSDLLDEHETTLHKNQEFSNDFLNNSAYTDDIQISLSDKEIVQKHNKFPNEAYADLMVLVTKYKLIDRKNLASTECFKHDLVLRNHENMRNYFDNGDKNSVFIEFIPNYFWNFNDINIYEATVIDRMHYLDLGLFKHQNNFILDLLKEQYDVSILDKIDNRLANIPRFLGLKIFKNGILSLVRITTSEYRNIMKVMIFILDNLNIGQTIQKKLLKLFEVWNNMYILSCYEEFTESDLNDFENLIIDWAKKFIALFNTYSNSELKFPKLYSWVYYTTDLIKIYGSLNSFSTETYESFHKDFVKKPYYLTNKQNIEDQILKMVQRQAVALKLLGGIHK
ncbi:hypothetical protein F8M41_006951 [Gigaspora margarita]|uniref:Uncharacterized protein n=1 Tax=Gigaspora margarita TaxID=4874 RepID=A0A8H4AWM0_GIGMA|nr:hypothetical protein F8M41_006951 [Gigaspora margarita]